METLHKQNNYSLVGYFRDGGPLLSWASLITVFFFLFTFYSPSLLAVKKEVERHQQVEDIVIEGETAEEKMANTLQLIKLETNITEEEIEKRIKEEGNWLQALFSMIGVKQMAPTKLKKLTKLNENIEELHEETMQGFNEVEQMLKDKELPDEIMQRHHDAVALYNTEYQTYQDKYKEVQSALSLRKQEQAIAELNEFLDTQQFKKSHQPLDPNNLPFGTPDSNVREPYTTKEEFQAFLNEGKEQSFIPRIAETLTDTLIETAEAAHDEPQPEDLLPTIDVQITQPIIDLANQLNNSPVEIYNWVRNNIEFIPSYGSMQGAEYTLEHGKGNAFDTSSLLISLLRAANIPARYAMGTVEISIDKVMNWVGGAEAPQAALQLLGQGGIPNVGLTQGGVFKAVRLEHVWVEAYVDFTPSQGAKNIQGDSWVKLDASFKQYDFTGGQDIENNVPFDAQGLIDQINQTATVNETEGYVQGLDQSEVEAALNNYRQQIIDYVNNQNPNATLGEVLGIQRVIVKENIQLAGGLPYKLLTQVYDNFVLPENLRHKFRYTLSTEILGIEGNRLITFEKSLPELVGDKHALSFRPTSQADEDLINSFIPEPDPVSGEIDPNQIPNSLPGYLINMTAEFTQNGETIQSLAAGAMGGELYETIALWSPNNGWSEIVNHPVVGEFRTIGLDVQGVNLKEAERLQVETEATQAALRSGDQAQLSLLSKNEIVGDLLYANIYSYLSINDIQDQIQARSSGIVNYRLPSFGLFSTRLQTSYFFGVPRNVSFVGLEMDVDRLALQVVAKNNDHEQRVNFVRASGARSSAMEHLIPEQIFSTLDNQGQGISAVKALAIASSEGQQIWTIDQNNLNQALAAINLSSDIENEIRNAVFAGNVVTAHEQPISFAGDTNTGYLIIDPETGSGAYLIASGANGGFYTALFISILAFLGALFLIGGGFVIAGIALFIWETISFVLWINAINNAENDTEFNQANMGQALLGILGLLLLPELGGLAIIALLFGIAFSFILLNSF